MNFFDRLKAIADKIGGNDGKTVKTAANSLEHIGLDDSFVPLKKYPGYFWNKKDGDLYSIKIGGVPRKLKPRSHIWNYSNGRSYSEKMRCYGLSQNGRTIQVPVYRIEKMVND